MLTFEDGVLVGVALALFLVVALLVIGVLIDGLRKLWQRRR